MATSPIMRQHYIDLIMHMSTKEGKKELASLLVRHRMLDFNMFKELIGAIILEDAFATASNRR